MRLLVLRSGIQLLEQEEALLNHQERVSVQRAAVTEKDVALEALEKDARDLQLAIGEEKRQIELKEREGPLKRRLEGEIAALQIEVGNGILPAASAQRRPREQSHRIE